MTDKIPSWAGRIAVAAVGSLVLILLGFMRSDVSDIATETHAAQERLANHETRIAVIEDRNYATREDIADLKSWIRDCIQASANNRECRP